MQVLRRVNEKYKRSVRSAEDVYKQERRLEMDTKVRAQLITNTFKRMERLGISQAEDIIVQLAAEHEDYKNKIKELEEQLNNHASGVDFTKFPEKLINKIASITTYSDGTVIFDCSIRNEDDINPPRSPL